MRGTVAALAIASLAAGCERSLPSPCGGLPCVTERTVSNTFQESVNRQLDVLFVIDDTSSIAPYAAAVASGVVEMVETLTMFAPTPSLHVGFVPASDCGRVPTEFVGSERCGQVTTFSGSLAAELTRLATFDAVACSPPRPLAAIERALAAPLPGFLRPSAYLLIVVISGADDASELNGSLRPVSTTSDFIRSLKPDPGGQIMISVIVPSDCPTTPSSQPLAPRLQALAQSAGGNGLVYALCNEHWGPAVRVAQPLSTFLSPKCLAGVRDVDPAAPGLQAQCSVTDTQIADDGTAITTVLPACDSAPPPCWRMTTASATNVACRAGTALISIERPQTDCLEGNRRTKFECLGCADANDPACGGG